VHLVALAEQKLGQVRAILPGNTRDQRALYHGAQPPVARFAAVIGKNRDASFRGSCRAREAAANRDNVPGMVSELCISVGPGCR
jgi:hypothetical protein